MSLLTAIVKQKSSLESLITFIEEESSKRPTYIPSSDEAFDRLEELKKGLEDVASSKISYLFETIERDPFMTEGVIPIGDWKTHLKTLKSLLKEINLLQENLTSYEVKVLKSGPGCQVFELSHVYIENFYFSFMVWSKSDSRLQVLLKQNPIPAKKIGPVLSRIQYTPFDVVVDSLISHFSLKKENEMVRLEYPIESIPEIDAKVFDHIKNDFIQSGHMKYLASRYKEMIRDIKQQWFTYREDSSLKIRDRTLMRYLEESRSWKEYVELTLGRGDLSLQDMLEMYVEITRNRKKVGNILKRLRKFYNKYGFHQKSHDNTDIYLNITVADILRHK